MTKFKKFAALTLATMTAVSAMGITVTAADDEESWQSIQENAEYGSLETVEDYGDISYSVDVNGMILPNIGDGVDPCGSTTPPSTLNPTVYLYGTGSVSTTNWYMNKDTSFTFTLNGSSAVQYSEFLVGATSTSQKIYLQPSGDSTANLNVSLYAVSSGVSSISSKTVTMRSSDYESIYFKGLKSGALYAIKVQLADSTSKTYTGTMQVSKTDF